MLFYFSENCTDAGGGPVHPLTDIIGGVQELLLGPSDESVPQRGAPSTVVVLDLSPLCPDASSASTLLDAEGSSTPLGKTLGKPAARALEKLLVGTSDITIIASGGTAQLALKLLRAGPDEHGLKPGTVSRLVLIHPRLPPACVNKQLSTPAAGASDEPVTLPELDCIFENETVQNRRLPMLRHAFPKGTAMTAVGDLARLLPRCASIKDSSMGVEDVTCARLDGSLDAGQADSLGRTLQAAELVYEMSRMTKQHEVRATDISAELTKIFSAASAIRSRASANIGVGASKPALPAKCADSERSAAASTLPEYAASAKSSDSTTILFAGGLVLRGNRCVLVRSLASPPAWVGMRIPTTTVRLGESPYDAAVRAVADACDIDGQTEVVQLPGVPPVPLYGPAAGLPSGAVAQIHLLYACRGPPPGPLEDADATDEDDFYDWYTWERAENALCKVGDKGSVDTLRAAAALLAAAAAAGHVKSQWGGIFGQEWMATAVQGRSRVGPLINPMQTPVSASVSSIVRGQAGGRIGSQALAAANTTNALDDGSCHIALSAAARALGQMSAEEALAALATLSAAATAGPRNVWRESSAIGAPGSNCSAAECNHARRSFIFRAKRPFRPAAIAAALASDGSIGNGGESGILRDSELNGVVWLATRNEEQVRLSLVVGGVADVRRGPPWWACVPNEEWPEGLAADLNSLGLWDSEHGDRQTELAIETRGCAASDAIEVALRECLLSEAEMVAGVEAWSLLDDPWWTEHLQKPFSFVPTYKKMNTLLISTSEFPVTPMPSTHMAEGGERETSVCMPCG